jgi:hypothetical protein
MGVTDEKMQYLTPESLKNPEVRKAAKGLLASNIFDIEETEKKRAALVDLLEPDDAEGYEELQREIDDVFYNGLF